MYSNVRGSGRILTPKARIFKAHTRALSYQPHVRFNGNVVVHIGLYPPDKRARDIDNCAKIVLDCLQSCNIIANDKQVSRLIIERKEIRAGGGCTVTVEEIAPN